MFSIYKKLTVLKTFLITYSHPYNIFAILILRYMVKNMIFDFVAQSQHLWSSFEETPKHKNFGTYVTYCDIV